MVAAVAAPALSAATTRREASPRLGTAATAAILLLAALAIRAPNLGHPTFHPDEQLYLHIGRAMAAGELLYVDVWDRKPIGLFAIYAASTLFGAGVLPYQLIATACAAGTAVAIAAIARPRAGPFAAAAAGVVYLAGLERLAGGGGQANVFTNLFTTSAALLTTRALADGSPRALGLNGTAASGLVGLALTVKQTAAFEGVLFAMVLLFALWRRTRSPAGVAGWALLFLAGGLIPTASVFGAYAAMGHADAFWFANVESILLKLPSEPEGVTIRLLVLLAVLLPLALTAAPGLRRGPLIVGWFAAATAGFAALRNADYHYAIPMLPPLCVAAATVFTRRIVGPLCATGVIAWALWLADHPGAAADRDRARAELPRLASVIRRHLGSGCLYVWSGPVALYEAAGACRPTRYPFPDHIFYPPERFAIGVSPQQEMRAIFSRRPTVVVTEPGALLHANAEIRSVLKDELSRGYRRVAVMPLHVGRVEFKMYVWTRLPGSDRAR